MYERAGNARTSAVKDYDRETLRYQALIVPAFIAACVLAVVLGRARGEKKRAAETPRRPAPTLSASPAPAPLGPIPPEPPFGPLRKADAELPCDVDDVFARKCRRCHGTPTRHGAPLTFYTWADMHAIRGVEPVYHHVGRVVYVGSMPFQTLTNPPVEPLTEAEKQIILDWVKAGAPKGNCDTGAPAASASGPAPRRKTPGKKALTPPKPAPPAASSTSAP
jgi:hypothetical protein